jgi:DNA-binding IclR family transcriptional regulator
VLISVVGETCYVAKMEGHAVRSIAMESPDSPWRGFVLPGKILQPHATASAKTIMAFQPKDIVDKALNGPLEKLTKHTLTTRAAVEADYKKIRERGYGTCIGEVDEALAAVAVPISVGDLGIAYSLGVVGPLPRITSLIKNDVNLLLAKHASPLFSPPLTLCGVLPGHSPGIAPRPRRTSAVGVAACGDRRLV